MCFIPDGFTPRVCFVREPLIPLFYFTVTLDYVYTEVSDDFILFVCPIWLSCVCVRLSTRLYHKVRSSTRLRQTENSLGRTSVHTFAPHRELFGKAGYYVQRACPQCNSLLPGVDPMQFHPPLCGFSAIPLLFAVNSTIVCLCVRPSVSACVRLWFRSEVGPSCS